MLKPFNLELDLLVVDTFEPVAATDPLAAEPVAAIAMEPVGRMETGCLSGCGGSVCG